MKDEDKTKEQRINELAELRQRIAELEASETERKQAAAIAIRNARMYEQAQQEVAERKRVEETLRLFKAIVEASQEAIAISDPDGQLLYINPAHEKLFGRSLEEARQLNYRDYYPSESVEILNRDAAPALDRGESWEGELDVFDANGRRFPLWERADSVRDADGKMLYGFGLMHDITERKQAEEALKASLAQIRQAKQEWESTADSLTSLVCLLDDRGRIIRANRTVENWNLGRVVEVKGWGMHELLHPGCTDPDCYLKTFQHRAWEELAQGRSAECEAEDGVLKRHLSIQIRPISDQKTDEEGKKAASFAVAVVHDITERKWAEAERERLLTTLNRRNIQLQTAAKVSKSASTILDPKELMNQAVNLIQEQFNFYYVGLFLVDKAGEYAVLRAGTGEAGRQMLEAGHRLAIGGESMIGWSMANAQARIALDVGKEAVRFDNPCLPDTRSEMALPLISRGQCIGALTVHSTEEAAFSEGDIAVLQTMADHLAIAIENARLYNAAQREITERKRAEEALRKSEERYRRVVQSVQDVIYATDAQGRLTFVSGACEELVGVPCERLLGKNLLEAGALVDISSDAMQQQFIVDPFAETVKKGLDMMVHEQPLKVRGETRWFEFKQKIEYGEEGNFVGGSGVMRDITERKRADEQIQRSLKEKEVLLKEIHHRVKNNLQVISSLLKLQSEYVEDKQSLKIFKESQDRVKSMALVHEQLYQSEDLARIDFAEYVRNLAADLFRSYRVSSSAITLMVDVDDISLDINTAIPCGLIINELVSNALKHAFPAGEARGERSKSKGEIRIELCSDEGGRLTLIVGDNGVGLPKDLDFQNTESLGLQLVNMLTYQLEGSIELDRSGGTAFKITFARPTH